jgi:hypothetical protein
MRDLARMHNLVLPFAVVGAAAGWLTAGFLHNPFIAIMDRGDEALAAPVAAGVAAGVGWMLTRWSEPAFPWEAPRITWRRLVLAVVTGGAATGGVVGLADGARAFEALTGAFSGALAGMAFVPCCSLILASARRAQRARFGSLVAGSDRRAVWGILLAALGATTAASALDWPFVDRPFYAEIKPPCVAVGILCVAGFVLAALMLADVLALRRIRVDGLEAREAESEPRAGRTRRLDLGLGEGVLVELARGGAAAYRSRERVTALVLGDPCQARSALRRALARGALGLGVVVVAAAAHVGSVLRAHKIYAGDVVMVPSLGRMIDRTLARL